MRSLLVNSRMELRFLLACILNFLKACFYNWTTNLQLLHDVLNGRWIYCAFLTFLIDENCSHGCSKTYCLDSYCKYNTCKVLWWKSLLYIAVLQSDFFQIQPFAFFLFTYLFGVLWSVDFACSSCVVIQRLKVINVWLTKVIEYKVEPIGYKAAFVLNLKVLPSVRSRSCKPRRHHSLRH